MFEQFGVPADGWAADYAGRRPSNQRSGTCVPDLGPKQLEWLNTHPIFADAARRAKEARGPFFTNGGGDK